jgi:uncharacterized protein (TIGR03067 family)
MRKFLVPVVFLALAASLRADDKDDAKKLNGTYEVTSVMVGGKPDPSKKMTTITFKDGTITIMEDGKKKEESATFKVDASKKPAHIEIMPEKEKKSIQGIYELKETDKGAELTIAFSRGADRPKDFKGEGMDTVVLHLLRKKDK